MIEKATFVFVQSEDGIMYPMLAVSCWLLIATMSAVNTPLHDDNVLK